MAKFTVRIELHDATWEEYSVLYTAMAAVGFLQTVTDSNGIVYGLPDGEYNWEGTGTRDQILDLAKTAAAKTRKTYSVLVTESNGRLWYGLEKK